MRFQAYPDSGGQALNTDLRKRPTLQLSCTILILTLKTACLTNIFKLRVGYADLVAPENNSLIIKYTISWKIHSWPSMSKWSEVLCFSYSSFYSGLAHSQTVSISRTSLRTGHARETRERKGSSLSPRAPTLLIDRNHWVPPPYKATCSFTYSSHAVLLSINYKKRIWLRASSWTKL